MNSPIKTLSLVAAVMIPIAAANAGSIFFLDGGEGTTTFTETVDGITLTVSNPQPSTITALPNFILTGSNFGFMTGFDFSFDTDVQLIGYDVGNTNAADGATFDLVGPNGNALANTLSATGSYGPTTSFFLLAGQTATLTSSFLDPDNGNSELLDFVVQPTSVPEPSTWLLTGGCLAGLIALRVRRGRGPDRELAAVISRGK